ncbi:protein of unknown function [Taphrina deformans PYCC 5710]|uniref:Uncharacterized protein n=1 Tax=Taphrina deformans (strain PYCC 5710 / ATCC 11124 / CBS 356.35 / IMI 108563 / JCM 9778 / NBRC 8474) TaxID=1097556 RepID=R4XJ46_TAPDE|nr:protein of unknown function [Taphrina deformans PYCC 5710]|eukprot:CCG83395.1 protein of unknown function [Taphrina deformans PYCC 5710]
MSVLNSKDVEFLVECLQHSDGGFPKPDFRKIKDLHEDEGLKIQSYSKRWYRLIEKLIAPAGSRPEGSVSPEASPKKRARGPMTPKRAVSPVKPYGEGLPAFRGLDDPGKTIEQAKKRLPKSPRKRRRVASLEDSDSVPEPEITSEGEPDSQLSDESGNHPEAEPEA